MRRVLVPADIDPAGPALGGHLHLVQGQTMGTTWSVRFVGPADADLAARSRGIQAVLDAVVAEMSTWEAGSDLSRFNRAPAGHWQTLPPDCFEVLACGLDVARRSGGACDPTAGRLVDLWGFGPEGRHDQPGFQPPTEADVRAAREASGWTRLEIGAASRRVRQPGGLSLDFSGIAKGFGVDQVARHLLRLGVRDHLVEVGGELRGAGVKPDGSPWWVDLEVPPVVVASLEATRVALHGLSVATSGDYRRHYDLEGVRHAHTIDPRDGRPVRHGVMSVTVLHRDCLWADAWSTALTVLGADAGLPLADAEGLAAHWIERGAGGEPVERWSRAFEDLMT